MLFFRGGAFCCYWRQIGIPDKCENVSKLRREAGGSSRGKFGLLGHHYGYCARARACVCVSSTLHYIFADAVPGQ